MSADVPTFVDGKKSDHAIDRIGEVKTQRRRIKIIKASNGKRGKKRKEVNEDEQTIASMNLFVILYILYASRRQFHLMYFTKAEKSIWT